MLVLNKVDLIKDLAKRELNTYSYKSLFGKSLDTVKVSAKTGRNIDDLIEKIKSYLPFGQKLYDEDEVTDQNMREITSEIIREKIIFATKDEIPHSVAVLIENYKSIIEYEAYVIRLSCGVTLFGENLNVLEISSDEIVIGGNFKNIEFEN